MQSQLSSYVLKICCFHAMVKRKCRRLAKRHKTVIEYLATANLLV